MTTTTSDSFPFPDEPLRPVEDAIEPPADPDGSSEATIEPAAAVSDAPDPTAEAGTQMAAATDAVAESAEVVEAPPADPMTTDEAIAAAVPFDETAVEESVVVPDADGATADAIPPEAVPVAAVVMAPPVAVDGPRRRPRMWLRFGVAFLISVLVVGIAGTGAIYAYEQQQAGRVLPGVRVGDVDVSGLDRAAVIARLGERYGSLGDGKVVVTSSVARFEIPYASFGRQADIDGMADAALAVGRAGNPIDRAVAEVRTVARGVAIDPWVTLDPAALADSVERHLAGLAVTPVDATVEMTPTGVTSTKAVWGRVYDPSPILTSAMEQLDSLDAPAEIDIQADFTRIPPRYDDTAAELATGRITRMIAPVDVTAGDKTWTIPTTSLATAITVSPTPDGEFTPMVDTAVIGKLLGTVVKEARIAPVNASFLVGKSGSVVGVTAAKPGRDVDLASTVSMVTETINDRIRGVTGGPIAPAFTPNEPTLTTEEAQQAAPLMTRISTWTTYFFPSIKNGFGVNIWIPSKLINGYVLQPGATFSFWKAIGTISRAKGYRDGGAIIDGHTEPTGALAGGICSCSTTLFNAALRAGLKMGQRRNHYYYIDRYPLGLDATVFKSSSGATTDMTFTNDTPYPILIRGINTRSGGRGYVRFDLYSVPTGRRVSLSTPIVTDIRPATTRIQYTSTLPKGARNQIEFPVAGRKVWVTRTVRDKNGNVIHKETYYSNYKRIDGIILVGR